MTYLESVTLVKILPCLAEPGRIIVIGKPNRTLAEVIPYLATLPGVIAFNPESCVVTFRREHGFMTIYPDRVYITQVRNPDEGLQLLAAVGDAVNATWDQRAQLPRIITSRRMPRPFDVWTQLPQTNCKQCGEATCLTFAVNLILHKRLLEECAPLQNDAAFSDRRATLEAML